MTNRRYSYPLADGRRHYVVEQQVWAHIEEHVVVAESSQDARWMYPRTTGEYVIRVRRATPDEAANG